MAHRHNRRAGHLSIGNSKSAIGNSTMPLVSREVIVSNKLGLHARPAMQFVDLANQFTSQITVYKGGDEPEQADGKSVMQMIILAATEGTPLKIVAEGEDAQPAVDQLVGLFENKFGEGE